MGSGGEASVCGSISARGALRLRALRARLVSPSLSPGVSGVVLCASSVNPACACHWDLMGSCRVEGLTEWNMGSIFT